MALLGDGSLQGSWWNGTTTESVSQISLKSGPASTNFTTIAMTLNAVFYGISNDTILEYSLDTSDPSTLTYVGQVYP